MGILEKVISLDQELSGTGKWLKGVVNDSLVVDIEKQLFWWNSKNIYGDVYVWLTKVKGMNHETAKEFLKQYEGYSTSFIQVIKNKEEQIVYPKLVEVFHEEGLNNSTEYWNKRGINSDTISRFQLGFYNNWYMIPIFQDGLFKNFQMRHDIPKKEIRSYYKNVGPLLFNSDMMKITDEIIITEGPTDCLRLSQEGIPCVCGTSGSECWLQEWYKYFLYQKKIYICYDRDSAGDFGAQKVSNALGNYRCWIYNFKGFEDRPGYDIVDFFNDGYKKNDLLDLLKIESRRSFEFRKG